MNESHSCRGRLIDGVGGKKENATLIIEGERIQEVVSGAKVPELAGFTRIDCRGRRSCPGCSILTFM